MMRCCKHCGALLEDDVQVCDFCGAVLEVPKAEPVALPVVVEEAPAQEVTKEVSEAPSRKKLSKKSWLIIAGIALAVIAVIVTVNLLIFSPHIAVDKYEAVMNGEFKKIADLAPKEYWEKMAEQNQTSVDKYIKKRIETLEEDYLQRTTQEGSFGKELSVEVEILDTYKVSATHFAGIKEALKSKYDIDPDRVNSAYKLHLKIIRKYTKDTIDHAGLVTAIQIDSQWYLIRYSPHTDGYQVSFLASGSLGPLLTYY